VFACRGEAGIAGMPSDETGRVREQEQRQAAAIVGVRDLDFLGLPGQQHSQLSRTAQKIWDALAELKPDVALTIYGGPAWARGVPNQRDHMEFAAAVVAAYDSLTDPPRWLFSIGPAATHIETVDGFLDVAVESPAAHEKYQSTLDPHTPVVDQARKVLDMTTPARADSGGHRAVGFILERSR
jgi:LmbE family N-acetylglucosaminyl deacetylase